MTEQTKKELEISIVAWLDLYKKLQGEIKELEERAADARTHIEQALGDDEIGTFQGRAVVRWTRVTSKRFDVQEAKKVLDPVIFGFLSKETVSRRFSLVTEE